MAQFNGNNPYLKFDSVEIDGYFVSVNPTFGGSSVDVTAGAGRTHVQRNGGLKDNSMSVTISYDVADIQTYVQELQSQAKVTVEYGPESNVIGKPRHVQQFIVDTTTFTQDVQKSFVTFEISLSGADEPTVDMLAGGVYA